MPTDGDSPGGPQGAVPRICPCSMEQYVFFGPPLRRGAISPLQMLRFGYGPEAKGKIVSDGTTARGLQ